MLGTGLRTQHFPGGLSTLGCFFRRSARAVERGEGGVGIVAVGGIEGIVERVVIRRIDGVAGIKPVSRVEGIIRCEGLRRIQRIARRILTGRIEDIVVALILRFGARTSTRPEVVSPISSGLS